MPKLFSYTPHIHHITDGHTVAAAGMIAAERCTQRPRGKRTVSSPLQSHILYVYIIYNLLLVIYYIIWGETSYMVLSSAALVVIELSVGKHKIARRMTRAARHAGLCGTGSGYGFEPSRRDEASLTWRRPRWSGRISCQRSHGRWAWGFCPAPHQYHSTFRTRLAEEGYLRDQHWAPQ